MATPRKGSVATTNGKTTWLSWFTALMILLGCFAFLADRTLASPRPEGSGGEDQTLSPYFVVVSDDPEKDSLPLKSTRADVKIAGKVAAVTVTQVYKNQGKKTLEAIYVFPGSTRAAVHALRMTVGERVIDAEIMGREKARQTYEDAKKAGQTASLLEQQRPNVFQMNVANILPGDEVKVELKYLELLKAEDSVYEFVYPTVVGPRYSKTAAAGAPDTEKWVASPYLPEGQEPPYTFGLAVDLKGGLPLGKLMSPSHEVEVKYPNPSQAQVTLKDEKTGGNRDFVLRYTLAGDKIDAGVLLLPGQDENFFLMVMEPPARVKKEAAVPREYIFIVDVSGSMNGFPLDTARALMGDIFQNLRPQDYMNVLLFESGAAVLSDSGSLAATKENKQKALAFINARPGGGGTEILPAFKRALALPRTKGTSRIVVAATDGYVNVEPELFEVIRQNLGEANLFPFGIGSSVNRFLIEGMARAGKGEAFVVLKPGEAPKQAKRFKRYIETPVLTDIKVSFPGFDAYDVEPAALPDLFAQRPLTLLGKYRGKPQGAIVITGKTAGGDFRQEVKLDPGQASPDNTALRFLWARERLHRLADYHRFAQARGGEDAARVKEITDLGLKYTLMTEFTSFVAVDKVKRADGKVVTVKQPLPLPQGVSDLAVPGGRPYRTSAKVKMMTGSGYHGGLAYDTSARHPGPVAQLPSTTMPPSTGPGAPPPPVSKEEDQPATPATLSLSVTVSQVKGQLAVSAVQQALAAELARLEKCYQEARDQGVKLPEKMTMTFTIGPDGKASKVSSNVRTLITLRPPELLTNCLEAAVKQITFPKPAKGQAQVSVELMLTVK